MTAARARLPEFEIKPFTAQVTVERHFKTKVEAERWAQEQDTKLTLAAEVDTISTSIWEPGS